MDTLEVNGIWPSLEGEILQEMICAEMYYQDELVETANVTYLKVQDRWLRLYFDCEIIFWRDHQEAPQDIAMSELESYFKNRDVAKELGFKNQIINSVEAKDFNPGVDVEFKFSNGKRIILYDVSDNSNFRT
jgi:hypothetical protein